MPNKNERLEAAHTYEDQFGHVPEELPPFIGRPRRPSRLAGLIANGLGADESLSIHAPTESETLVETVASPIVGTFVLERLGDVAVAYVQPADTHLV